MTVRAALGLAAALQDRTLSEFIDRRDQIPGSVHLLLLLVFAIMPRLRLRRHAQTAAEHSNA